MSALGRTALATALVITLLPALASAQPLRRHKAQGGHYAHRTVHRYAYGPRYGYAYPPAYGYGYGYDAPYSVGGPYGPNSADPYPPKTAADDPYSPYAAPGAAIRALARRNQYAPGVTNELAPDNIATATGGPSGGVPGFSGH